MLTLNELLDWVEPYRKEMTLPVRSFELGGRKFGGNTVDLMGVVNLSADSWYRESVCLGVEQAIRRGKRLAVEGAALVDVGAESTLAHAERVEAALQTSRMLPVIKGLAEAGVLVSVETYEPAVAEACLEAGAKVLNLTSAARWVEMFQLAGKYNAGLILCYVQGNSHVREVGDFVLAEDHLQVLQDYFRRGVELAETYGVRGLWLDPGMGFYYRNLQDGQQRVRYQMATFLQTFRLRKLGWPVCHALPHAFEFFGEEVRSAEGFFAVLALLGGTGLLRTHEVARVAGVLRTMEVW